MRLIRCTGRGCALAKTDVKNAFCSIPINPGDYDLLGIFWEGRFYFNKSLPMGASSSCKIWEALSTALEWIAQYKIHITGILHYLDDFLIIDSTLSSCVNNLELGVPMAPEKNIGPSTVLSFAGIKLDTCKMEARLPQDKLCKDIMFIQVFLKRKKVSLREMQSLVGLLNFTCSVVTPGRTFLRVMINLTVGIWHLTYLIRLTRAAKDDLKLWLDFLTNYNGKSFFPRFSLAFFDSFTS